MANKFVMTEDTLTPGLQKFPGLVDNEIRRTVDFFSPRVESYARTKAPWTDQTGNARSSLHATTSHLADKHSITIAHGMPYGIWLELRFEGKYAIIIPTIKAQGAELMNTLRSLFRRMH